MASDLSWTAVETPLGSLAVAVSPAGVVATDVGGPHDRFLENLGGARLDDAGLGSVRRDVEAYFAGRSRRFAAPVDLSFAAAFSKRVYEATMAVRYGELRTYGDVAAAAGSHRAYRAAGTALRQCPIELWIPCHRIVPAGPGFGTYGGHPERREFLLRLEGAI